MQGVTGTTIIRNAALLATFSLVLSGCLSDEKATSEQQEVEITNHVTGSVGDGPVVGAAMRVVRSDGGVLQEFVSDTFADFDIAVKTKSGNYPLIIEARDGIDLVTGQAPDFTLFGAIPAASESTTANVNPFTTFTVEIAKDLPGGLTAENLAAAEQIVVNSMNSGLTSLVATGPSGTQIDAANIAEVIKASEALSETVRRTRNQLQRFGTTTSGNDVIRELSSDLIDNIRDGNGGSRTDARTAAISTVVSVQVLLEAMSNELHVNDVDATDAMSAAIDQVIGTTPSSGIADQTVTAQMLETVRVGLAAAFAVSGSPKVAELQEVVSGMQAGMDFMLVRTLLPDDYRATLDNVLTVVAGGDILVVNTINNVVRNGGAAPPPNRTPTISGSPPTQANAGSSYSFTPTANDADGDLLLFSIFGRPAWATFDTSTGTLSGTPSPSDAGNYNNIMISVSDGAASASLAAFSIIVSVDNTAPMISGTPPSQLSVGAQYDFTPSASDPDGSVLIFSITNRPAWINFNSSTGQMSGSPGPNNVGSHNNIVISVSDGAASASLPAFSIIVNAVNSVPTISGNPSSQVTVGGQYDFIPSASDADGDTLAFNITNRPAWASFDPVTGQLSGSPSSADVGTHNNIVISVTDGAASAVLPAFSIIVNLDNSAPSIGGTPNTQVSVGGLYDFTPTATDPDGNVLTFSITNQPPWASFDTTTGRLSGSPGAGDVGPHNNIVISVTDGAASASLPAFSVNVTTSNTAPTIAGSPPAQVAVGTAYDFTPTASDPDGDMLTFSINNRPSWAGFDTATGRLSGTPGSGNVGSHNNIVISVSDGAASATLAAFSIIVDANNVAPTISGNPPNQGSVGSPYNFTPTASDADGDTLTFSITNRPAWASFNAATGNLSGTPGAGDAGSYNNIVINVSDGQASASLPAFTITVAGASNSAPTISGTPPSQLPVGAQYDFTPSASDPDGSVLTFSITNRPAWINFNSSTGQMSGSPGPNHVGSHNNIVISVSDGAASASLPAFSIIVIAVNSVPTISGNPSSQITVGGQYDFIPSASDADGDTLAFNITNRPAWASFDPVTGQLSGSPSSADVGAHNNIVISVTDGAASAVLPAFSIIVNLNNSAPSIGGTPNTLVSVGESYDFTPTATDPDGNVLTFSITNQPPWASFDTTTGRLSGSPGAGDVGPHNNIVISVTDGAASASLPAFAINVTTSNAAPTIAGSPPAQVVVGDQYDFTPTASDPDGDTLTFSINNRPSWASFDTATGRLSGTPGSGNVGSHNNIVISVSDGAASATLAAFSIIVDAANSTPTISGTPPNQGSVGSPYNFTPTAGDADGDTLTFSITNRPAWASFNAATGNLSGTPGAGDAGSYNNIVINVSDGQASASLPAFAITVAGVSNSAPTISGTPPSQVNANTAYSFTPTASDPDGDALTFSVSGLPGWANFNTSTGQISGTPTDANVGVYSNISITVSDTSNASATLGPFSITVNAVSLGSVTLTWTPPTQNEDGTPLTDLAGYWIYWGTTPGSYPNSVRIDNPGISSYVVDNLAPGTYEFVATSFNSAEVQSAYSNPATKVVP